MQKKLFVVFFVCLFFVLFFFLNKGKVMLLADSLCTGTGVGFFPYL